MMYSTSQVADLLITERQNVYLYIKKGFLNAILVEGEYQITRQDYITFRDEYYDTDKRNSSRGIAKKLSDEQITLLGCIISDITNQDLNYIDFTKEYKNKKDLIPQIQDFIIYKRDRCIKYDHVEYGTRYKALANTYGLSVRAIEEIVNQNKRSDF